MPWAIPVLIALAGQQLAPPIARDRYPVISPDGTLLLFESDRNGSSGLWISKTDGSDLRQFNVTVRDPTSADWSPDGRQVVFAATVDGQSEIYLADRDAHNLRRLTNYAGDDNHPHWSADGRRIFFNSDRGTPNPAAPWDQRRHNIFSISVDGSDLRQHTNCERICTNPNPSPDGRMLAFRRIEAAPGRQWSQAPSETNSEIVVARIDGSDPLNVSHDPAYDTWPAWSPDSRWVLFGSNRDGRPATGQIYRVRPDGSGLQMILIDPQWSLQEPRSSPDGKTLYFSKSATMDGGRVSTIAAAPMPTD